MLRLHLRDSDPLALGQWLFIFSVHLNHEEGLWQHRFPGPSPRVSGSVVLKCGLRMGILGKCHLRWTWTSSSAAGVRTTPGEHLNRRPHLENIWVVGLLYYRTKLIYHSERWSVILLSSWMIHFFPVADIKAPSKSFLGLSIILS